MSKQITQMVKGLAILIMIAHHFLIYNLVSGLPDGVVAFGQDCKICVGIYAVLSGYGYFFAKDKTVRYGLRKIWGLLQIYWISLFTIFIPAALNSGWKITPLKLFVQMFALLPNLNWFAWYVFFYIFCMMVMPLLCKYRAFRFKPIVNLTLILIVPFGFELGLHSIPNYEEITFFHDLFSCFLYFPCFLIGYWMAENKMFEKIEALPFMNNILFSFFGAVAIMGLRMIKASMFGFLLDVFYAPLFIYFVVNIFKRLQKEKALQSIFSLLGKYSTGIWFFHAVFFSTYICDWFQPVVKVVHWAPLMYLWLVLLSFTGAFFYQKILDVFHEIPLMLKRSI